MTQVLDMLEDTVLLPLDRLLRRVGAWLWKNFPPPMKGEAMNIPAEVELQALPDVLRFAKFGYRYVNLEHVLYAECCAECNTATLYLIKGSLFLEGQGAKDCIAYMEQSTTP